MVIKTPNVTYTKRKAEPDASDYTRYAEVIDSYREFLKKTALAEDISLGRGHRSVPTDWRDLLEWVRDPKNLDAFAESFRRTCSGFVSTNRLFAVCSGPIYYDWSAVLSMMKTSEEVMSNALCFLEIGHQGRLQAEAEELEDILGLLKDLRERLQYAELPGRPLSGKDLSQEAV